MQTEWTILRPGEPSEKVTGNLPEVPGFSRLSNICRPLVGGDIERVRVWYDSQYLDMFVNEQGALLGLPVNHAATEIYHANIRTHFPAEYARQLKAGTLPPIAGCAVLFCRAVWF
jgi:hypothetical protein